MRVVVMPPFDREYFGGKDRLELNAPTLFAMVGKLDDLAPGFAEIAEARAAFAIDGVFVPDWTSSLAGAVEVILLPRVSGGEGLGWSQLEPFGVEILRERSSPVHRPSRILSSAEKDAMGSL